MPPTRIKFKIDDIDLIFNMRTNMLELYFKPTDRNFMSISKEAILDTFLPTTFLLDAKNE